ncbi:MAG: radical SAM protein [Acidobacteriia bacterium]|nr:radical SAM protein [Terriglobia bacterium]
MSVRAALETKIVWMTKALRFCRTYVRRCFDPNRYRAPSAPHLSIESTNVCNAKCAFCANPVMQRKKQPLSMELFKKAVDELAAMGSSALDFNVTIGDPLLDPYLLERARYATRTYPQFNSVGFVTTLQWLHRFPIDEFWDSGIKWISISTALSGREKYAEFFGVDKYDQMMRNLLTLIEENKRRENKIIYVIHIKPTNEPVEAVLKHADFQRINSMVEQDLVANVKTRGAYVDDWQGAVQLPPYLKKRPLVPRAFRPCAQLFGGMIVYSNGNVGACNCRDFEASSELTLGNVKDNTLAELWSGEKVARLRSEWRRKNKVPEICKTCRHYNY